MNQMAMMSLGGAYQGAAAAVTPQQIAHAPPQNYQPPALPHYQQGYYNMPQQSGGRGRMVGQGGGRSHSRCGGTHGRGSPQVPIPYVGGTHLIPYVQRGMQQGQRTPCKMYTNKMKWYVNQKVCHTFGFDVKDWHMSTTCQYKKQGHQDGFTHTNYMHYAQAGYPFCMVVMHKNIYPLT
jgi:hypothetical protein